MITLHRLGGESFALNPDLIERVEPGASTRIVLVDGAVYEVAEGFAEVVERIRDARAEVVARSTRFDATDATPAPPLRLLPVQPAQADTED